MSKICLKTIVKKCLSSRGILLIKHNLNEDMIVLSTKECENYPIAFNVKLPKIMGYMSGKDVGESTWQIRSLYAKDSKTAVLLMCAALEHWKRVVPHEIVSNSVFSTIKRYFNHVKYDSTCIEHSELGFLNATYLGPVGFNFDDITRIGEQRVNSFVDVNIQPLNEITRVKKWLQVVAEKEFRVALYTTNFN